MKKLLLTAATAALALSAAPADAEEMQFGFGPYIGFDLHRIAYDYNDSYSVGAGAFIDGDLILEDALYGGNVHIGTRLHKNFGLELGYFHNIEESQNVAAGATVGPGTVAAAAFTTDVKTHGFTLDALGYLPVAPNFELIGTLGLSWTDAEISLSSAGVGQGSADEDEFGYRAGVGAQYQFSPVISARTLIHYQYADFDNIADDAWQASLGLNYHFK